MFAEGLAGCTLKHVFMRVGLMGDRVPPEHSTSSGTAGTGARSKDLSPGCGHWPGKPQRHLGSELSLCARSRSHLLCIISHLVLSLLAQGWPSPDCTLLAKPCAWEGKGRGCRQPASEPQAEPMHTCS